MLEYTVCMAVYVRCSVRTLQCTYVAVYVRCSVCTLQCVLESRDLSIT